MAALSHGGLGPADAAARAASHAAAATYGACRMAGCTAFCFRPRVTQDVCDALSNGTEHVKTAVQAASALVTADTVDLPAVMRFPVRIVCDAVTTTTWLTARFERALENGELGIEEASIGPHSSSYELDVLKTARLLHFLKGATAARRGRGAWVVLQHGDDFGIRLDISWKGRYYDAFYLVMRVTPTVSCTVPQKKKERRRELWRSRRSRRVTLDGDVGIVALRASSEPRTYEQSRGRDGKVTLRVVQHTIPSYLEVERLERDLLAVSLSVRCGLCVHACHLAGRCEAFVTVSPLGALAYLLDESTMRMYLVYS